MNKSELIASIAAKTGDTKAATERFVNALGETLKEQATNGGGLILSGVLKMEVSTKPARTVNNPKTGAKIAVPEKKVVKLKAFKPLSDAANTQ